MHTTAIVYQWAPAEVAKTVHFKILKFSMTHDVEKPPFNIPSIDSKTAHIQPVVYF